MPEPSAERKTISFRVDPDLRARLDERATASSTTLSQVIEQIIRRDLIGSTPSVEERMARIEQIVNRFDGRHRADVRILKELIGSFVYLFMMYFPQLPEGVRDAAQIQASRRMADFIAFVSGSLKEGISVLNPEDAQPMSQGIETEQMAGSISNNQTGSAA